MARLQITIADEVDQILNHFSHAVEKRLFVEYAIKLAANNPEICEIFGLNKAQLSVPVKASLSNMNMIQVANNKPAAKVNIDSEFDSE